MLLGLTKLKTMLMGLRNIFPFLVSFSTECLRIR